MNLTELESKDIIINTKKKYAKKICCGIYGLRNKINNKWYIGQSIDIDCRWKSYKNLHCKKQCNIFNALIKYKVENFEFKVIEECEPVDWVLDYREMFWIKILNSYKNGYNMTMGGSHPRPSPETKLKLRMGMLGRKIVLSEQGVKNIREAQRKKKLTPEHMQKMLDARLKIQKRGYQSPKISEALKGRKFSDEHKLNLSLAKRGKPGPRHSDETKRKMSAWQIGKKLSEETKRKISETKLKKSEKQHN